MKNLIKGLHKFQTEVFPIQKNFFQELAKGQTPEILFITCSDSRVNPNLVTSSEPGDMFIIRNAGNIVPLYGANGGEQATIEFAVTELMVQDIILCGHSFCGAIQASTQLERYKHMPSLIHWVQQHIEPTLALVKENYPNLDDAALLDVLTQEHVLRQVENLKTHPTVSKKVAEGTLALHAWIYTFETGEILAYNVQEGQFERISSRVEK